MVTEPATYAEAFRVNFAHGPEFGWQCLDCDIEHQNAGSAEEMEQAAARHDWLVHGGPAPTAADEALAELLRPSIVAATREAVAEEIAAAIEKEAEREKDPSTWPSWADPSYVEGVYLGKTRAACMARAARGVLVDGKEQQQ